ncbi:MAG: hypothetical protein WA323_22130 [Candidatus Nitrosopolaris sp.]
MLRYVFLLFFVKYLDHLSRIYIKSKGEDTLCRVEITTSAQTSYWFVVVVVVVVPVERIERQITQIYDMIRSIRCLSQQRDFTEYTVDKP